MDQKKQSAQVPEALGATKLQQAAQWAADVVRFVYECEGSVPVAVTLTEGRRAYCLRLPYQPEVGARTARIVLGTGYVQWVFGGGWRDYARMRELWGPEPMSGWKALWAITLHECAHVYQTSRTLGSCHNGSFALALTYLQAAYPFALCVAAVPPPFGQPILTREDLDALSAPEVLL